MSRRRFNIFLCIMALTWGGLLYLVFRENTYFAHLTGDFSALTYIRDKLQVFACDFLLYYFPDMLWGFSLACGLQAIHSATGYRAVVCGCIAFLCGTVWELMQLAGLVGGTGDVLDVLMYLLAGMISILINIKERTI